MKTLNIYTDGACSGNQNDINIGGYGAILEFGEHQKELFGGEANTTNNRMEMLALIASLQAINKENQEIRVFSDSSYLINCFREKWYENWYRNNWKTSKKSDVENRDLWETLFSLINKHNIHYYKVKGHVDLNSKNTKLDPIYEKFIEWNGSSFKMEDFIYITKMNNKADALANKGIDSVRNNEL